MNEEDLPPVQKWTPYVVILDNGRRSLQTALFAAAGFGHAIDRLFQGSFAVFGEDCRRFCIKKRKRGEKIEASDVQ